MQIYIYIYMHTQLHMSYLLYRGWRLSEHQIQSLMSSNQLRAIILNRTSINYTPSLTDGQTVIRYVT